MNPPENTLYKDAEEPTSKQQRNNISGNGNIVTTTTTYDYTDKPYLKALVSDLEKTTFIQNENWTIVNNWKQKYDSKKFLFVGNIPTKATSWAAVKGD